MFLYIDQILATPRKAGNVHYDLKPFVRENLGLFFDSLHLLSQQYARCILENVCPEFPDLSTKIQIVLCIY